MKKEEIKIFIVEDSQGDIIGCINSLKKRGYSQIKVINFNEPVIKQIDEYQLKVVLMDTQIEGWLGMGYEVCEQIREKYPKKGMVIFGMSRADYEFKWRRAGADGFFYKPTEIDEKFGETLDKKIQEALVGNR